MHHAPSNIVPLCSLRWKDYNIFFDGRLVQYGSRLRLYWLWHLVDGFKIVLDIVRVVLYELSGSVDMRR